MWRCAGGIAIFFMYHVVVPLCLSLPWRSGRNKAGDCPVLSKLFPSFCHIRLRRGIHTRMRNRERCCHLFPAGRHFPAAGRHVAFCCEICLLMLKTNEKLKLDSYFLVGVENASDLLPERAGGLHLCPRAPNELYYRCSAEEHLHRHCPYVSHTSSNDFIRCGA